MHDLQIVAKKAINGADLNTTSMLSFHTSIGKREIFFGYFHFMLFKHNIKVSWLKSTSSCIFDHNYSDKLIITLLPLISQE
jgi:hypothetical protein